MPLLARLGAALEHRAAVPPRRAGQRRSGRPRARPEGRREAAPPARKVEVFPPGLGEAGREPGSRENTPCCLGKYRFPLVGVGGPIAPSDPFRKGEEEKKCCVDFFLMFLGVNDPTLAV